MYVFMKSTNTRSRSALSILYIYLLTITIASAERLDLPKQLPLGSANSVASSNRIWPTSIDWTSAVIGTYVASALTTLSTSFESLVDVKDNENMINKYFAQLVGSYFGQDAFSLRQQAYDDMLWVVLGWLEGIKFINTHSTLHYSGAIGRSSWHGNQYIPAFAHRARIFWDLASAGWDTRLCNGGMIWSPYLTPYKNAITNELYISASISMYLYFPGDNNTSPFGVSPPGTGDIPPAQPHDPKYLAAAVEGYKWLTASNMTDAQGLYVDGYHVSNWSSDLPPNSTIPLECDERNEMVYTYNQGVLLTGQRGLYEATGVINYLDDGHHLVENVIAATGWNLSTDSEIDDSGKRLKKWYGLGRGGVLEDACDADGYCSQDSQTFKGIFFHHLTLFCTALPYYPIIPGDPFIGKGVINETSYADDRKMHSKKCGRYKSWIRHNAEAAVETRNEFGRYGMWWGAPSSAVAGEETGEPENAKEIPPNAVDYRNQGVPAGWKRSLKMHTIKVSDELSRQQAVAQDLNDRGRGRTVETQGGGVAVLRAAWELADKEG
ncbi:hypothetical protein B0O99DRAFT_650972 [Bisporella sp. PMI_857]|nr:hypothetical protein B0O99DRAFT_650972 [Bisporella sp. PMI_857]